MKKLIIILGILVMIIAAHVSFAQSEGTITYEVKTNLHRRLPAERAEMKAMIPEFRITKDQLFFNEAESLYKPIIEDEEEDMNTGGGGGVQIRMRPPNSEFYLNQAAGKIISKQEFMGKHYIIEDSIKLSPWKFGSEIKTIAGYECRQAYYTDETDPNRKLEVTAWYTDKIRPFLGPERFNTLPGAVLAVDINNGERVLVARNIEIRELKKNELKVPASGQKISRQEFRKMVDEQMEKMRTSGGVFIRN